MRTFTQKMALWLMTLLCCAAMPQAVMAQDCLVIGEGTAHSSWYLPVANYYHNCYSQQLFLADELEIGAAQITSIAFQYDNYTSAMTRTISVYMANTDAADLSTAFVTEGLEEVLTPTVFTFDPNDEWSTIELGTPFDYDGSSNLVVAVYMNYSSAETSYAGGYRFAQEAKTDMSRYVSNDTSSPDQISLVNGAPTAAGTSVDYRCNMQLCYSQSSGGPTCDRPSGIAASDVTAHEATLAWADGNGVYNVEYKKAGDTIWTVLLSNTMENSIALANLEPTTAYQARVQSVCADLDTVSGWRTCNFTTQIGLPYTASLATQGDWTKASGLLEDVLAGSATLSTGGSWNFGARNGVLGANHAYVNVYGSNGRYWIISPEIPLEGNTELTFNLALTDWNNANPIEDFTAQADDKFVVLASSDNGETWAILEQWDNQGSANVYNQIATAGEEVAVDLSAFADQNVRIAFYVESTQDGGDNDLHVGGVHIEHLPPCARVSDFAVSNITKTSAEFSWTANAGEAAWRFEYKKAADAEWISADITENPYLLEGLDVYTTYEARIAAICDASAEDGISAFRKPISFKTVAGIPFLETFNDAMPNEWKRYTCWLDSLMEDPDNYALQAVSAGWKVDAANGAFAASDNHLFLNIEGAACHYWLVSPTVELEDNVQLTFDLALTKSQGQLQPIEPGQQDDDKFYVLYTLDGGATWDVLKYWDNGTSDEAFDNISSLADGQSVAIDLSEFAGQSIAIAFYGESSEDNGDNNLHIDNVRIDIIPDCSRPTGLIVENVTDNSAAFAWDEPEDGIAAWEYALIANPAADTVPAEEAFANSIGELTLTLSGLQENTPYAFFLRHVCDEAHSEYVVRNFKTMQTPAELPFEDGFEEGLNWVISNGEYTNKWILGEAAHYGEGTHALYISNDGTAHAYSNGSGVQMVFATKTFYFPEEGVYSVSFDWLCNAEGNYDVLCVALLPDGLQPEPSGPTGQWALPEGFLPLHEGTKLNGVSTWQSSSYELNIEEEGVHTIALIWRQDISGGENPPAAVDNFRIARLSCPAPIEFAIVEESATTNSVQLEWTPKAGENYWLIQYRKAGAEEWNYVADSVKAIPYTLSGLDASSVYEVRVAAWCNPADSASVSDFSASVQFQTACAAITSFPYSENFDAIDGTTSSSTRVLPICWSAINTTTYASYSGLPHVYNSSSYANSGTNSLRLYSYASSTSDYDPQDQYAILPEMEGLSSLRIKFNARAYYAPSASYNSTFVVGVMSDPENEATFEPVQQFTIPATTYAPYEVKLNTYAGEGKYIAFKLFAAVAPGQYINSAYIDDIVIDEIPSCPEAEGLKVYGVTATSASFSWNVEEGESYVYALALASAEAPAAEDYAPASDSMLISGLTENTAYVLYLRHDCGSSLSPAISAPFNTKQMPVAVPYSDDFEAGNNWLLINGDRTNVWVHGEAAHNGEGTHALYISNDGGATNAYTITSSSVVFATKSFTFEQGTYAFQYDWKANGESTYDYLRVALVPDDVELVAGTLPSGVTTTALPEGCIALDGGSKLNLSTAWATFRSAELTIPAGTYKVVFLWKDDTSGGAQEPAAIDNFSISKVACGQPTGLMASDITASSVVLKWTADADQNEWEIVYSTNASFNPAEAEPVIASANPFVLENLDPETTYYAYVRAACGDENYSSWSSILTFATVSSCALPDGFALEALSTNTATLSWNTYGQAAFNFSYSADTAAGWIDSLNITMPFTINGLEAGTVYAIKVQPVCAAAADEWTDVMSFKTAYEAPYAENFSAASSEWTKASGLLADILSGAAQLTSSSGGWSVTTGNGVFEETDNHLRINIYGTSCKYWYIAPDVKIGANNQLSFDLALTAYSGTLAAPAQTGTDDKFAVLISADGWQTWSILRQWDNAGSAYVYNNIACAAAGEPVAISLAEYEGQTVSIAFYGESTSSNADNNLHVDNFLIDVVPACPKTTGLHIAGLKDTRVSFAWDEEDAAWEYGLVMDTVAEFVPQDADFTGSVAVNELTIDQLVPQTAYLFFLRKVCGEDYSEIQYIRFATTATPATLPYNQDFESGNDWELINGICNNKWIVGSATSHGGANALYVSNDDVNNVYFENSSSMVYAAKLFDFDQPGTYTVQYYWKAGGESTYDYLRVALVPASVELAASTSAPSGFGPTGLPAGWIAADGGTKLNLSEDSWAHVEVEVEVNPALYYVVFAWRNDNSTGTQAPAAVDDIHIRHIAYPTDIQSAGIESTAVKFIRNDQVYILMNGAVYNVTGQKVEVK